MIDLKKYAKLKDRVDELQKESNRAEGALAQTMARLKEEFDVDTIKEAEELKEQLEEELKEAEEVYEKTLEKFESKWGHLLEG